MSNLTVQQQQNLTVINSTLKSPDIYTKIQEMLGRKPDTYITSVMQVLESNSMFFNVAPESVTGAVITSCSMNLPINNNLGFSYIIPFKRKFKDQSGKWSEVIEAQYMIGYKGFIQLAQRTGQIRSINAIAVYDTDTDETVLKRLTSLIPQKVEGNIIGYTARLETITGFVAYESMTEEDLNNHAYNYSQTYKSAVDKNQSYSVWHKNRDAMAKKTVIKKIMKYCPMSVELQKAMEVDQGVVGEDGNIQYPDNEMKDITPQARKINDEEFARMENAVKSGKLKKDDALNPELYELTEYQYEAISAIEVQ